MNLQQEVKLKHLLMGAGICVVVALILAYFLTPYLLRTETIDDGARTVNVKAGPQKSSPADSGSAVEQTPRPTLPKETLCAEVITTAQDPRTGETVDFPTPCDVPVGWQILKQK